MGPYDDPDYYYRHSYMPPDCDECYFCGATEFEPCAIDCPMVTGWVPEDDEEEDY